MTTTWEPRPCGACSVQVIHARHCTSGKALVLDAERVAGGGYRMLDYQRPGAAPAVRPLTPTERTGTAWGTKAYQVHKCEGRRP